MEKTRRTNSQEPEIKCDYRVKLYEDGKYHWLYDLNLLKNPGVLLDVLWVMSISMGIVFIILFMIQACEDGLNIEGLSFVLKITGFMAAIMLVLSLLGYLLYAAISGWTYTVHFIMDENGVVHKQAPKSEKIAKRIGLMTILAGIVSRKPSTMGAGMLSASRTEMRSDFSDVRKVKAIRWMNTIKVNELFGKNRVYVNNADFDFVYNFICSHCARVMKK